MGDATTRRPSRTIGFVVGLAALAAVPALGLGAYAAADTSSGGSTPDGEAAATPTATRPRHMLTDAQKQCLSDHGVTLPQPSATGGRPQLSPEQRDALRTAAQACGIELPHPGPRAEQPQTA